MATLIKRYIISAAMLYGRCSDGRFELARDLDPCDPAALRVLMVLLRCIGIVEVAMSPVFAKFDAAAVAGEDQPRRRNR